MSKAEELAKALDDAYEVDERPMDKEVAAELRRLAAENEALKAASIRVLKTFPTDTDMVEMGWSYAEIEEACRAHEALRAAIDSAMKENPHG